MKKSQLSIFIIVGLVLLLIIVFFSLQKYNEQEKTTNDETLLLEFQAEQIEEYVEQCIYDLTLNVIYNRIGLQGGFSIIKQDELPGLNSADIVIPYWFYNGEDVSPSLKEIEDEMKTYLVKSTESCLSFENLISLQGTTIEKGKLSEDNVKISINEKDVSVTFYYPITLKNEKSTKEIKEYNAEIPVPLGQDYSIAREILQKTIDHPEGYNLGHDCDNLNKPGYVKIFYFNDRIIIRDYEPLAKSMLLHTFTFQFLVEDLKIYGYCE